MFFGAIIIIYVGMARMEHELRKNIYLE